MNLTPREIADRFDLHRSRHGWRGRCPACSYPDAAILSKAGKLRCVSCRDDEAIEKELERKGAGSTHKEDDPKPTLSREEKIASALAVWNGASTAVNTPADFYLSRRCLPGLAASSALRWRTDVPHPEVRARILAMIALVVDAANTPIAIHRTYLTLVGHKATVEPVKAAKGPLWGGAIRLDPIATEIVIGEGIESSAAAGKLLGLPAWAAVSCGNLAKGLVLPPDVRSVVIAADHDIPDAKGIRPGQDAAHQAARRWRAEGRTVRVATPDTPGTDFADVLSERAYNA